MADDLPLLTSKVGRIVVLLQLNIWHHYGQVSQYQLRLRPEAAFCIPRSALRMSFFDIVQSITLQPRTGYNADRYKAAPSLFAARSRVLAFGSFFEDEEEIRVCLKVGIGPLSPRSLRLAKLPGSLVKKASI